MGDNSLEGVDCVDVLIATLAKYGLHTYGNHSWIIYALRAHLVQSLLNGKIPVHCPQVATVASNTRIMLCTLASYAFYPAVLRHLSEESSDADAMDVSDTTHKEWSLLVHYIKLLRVFKEKFNESLFYVPKCENTQIRGHGKSVVAQDANSSYTALQNVKVLTGLAIATFASLSDLVGSSFSSSSLINSTFIERDVLLSPRFTKFLQFLIEKQLASNKEEILQLLQCFMKVPTPAILHMDFSNPSNMMRPVLSIGISNSEHAVLAGERIPLLVPRINIP
ncbi:hypothetical protein H0H93_013771, partial [Arthromyces matolae]